MTQASNYPIFSEKRPSETIEEIVADGGSCAIDCEQCGRTHFDSSGEDMDKGELENLLAGQKANPKKYVAHGNKIYHGYLNGKQVVVGCPCNALTLFENMVWQNRYTICEYIAKRAKNIKDEATGTEKAVQEAAKAIK